MDLTRRRQVSWISIAVLALPALALYGYSLRHPGIKGKDDRLIPIIEKPAATSPSSPWKMQESGTTAGLRGIYSVDGKVVWASGTGGTVLRTVDGGEHWTKCAVPDAATDGATLDFRGVQAWDATTAIVMASGPGEKSRLYKTSDGCGSWTLLFKNPDSPEGFFDCIWMHPSGAGILLGDPVQNKFVVFETEDGGKTWHRNTWKGLSTGAKPLAAFAASNSLFSQFRNGYMRGFVTGGPGGAYLVQAWSTEKWKKIGIPIASGTTSSGVFSLGYRFTRPRCADCVHSTDQFFIAAGGDYTKPNDSDGTAAYSLDGGYHWQAADKMPHGYRSAVQWGEDLKAWITVGTNGSDIDRDDGKTWQPLDDGNWNALSLPFVVGPNGRIARLALIPAK